MQIKYDLDKIKFSVDQSTFEKAVRLYEGGKVESFEENCDMGFAAVVQGTKPYRVYVHKNNFEKGMCECYMGQRNYLCKHMVAVAIYAVQGGDKLTSEDKGRVGSPKCSGEVREVSKEELSQIKKNISSAMRYIKPYDGPSKIWFAYQNSLDQGCARLSGVISALPVNVKVADILVSLLLRLDKRLSVGGVDDSNGTVGNFMIDLVDVLKEYVDLDGKCVRVFKKLVGINSCFGWEGDLVGIYSAEK